MTLKRHHKQKFYQVMALAKVQWCDFPFAGYPIVTLLPQWLLLYWYSSIFFPITTSPQVQITAYYPT